MRLPGGVTSPERFWKALAEGEDLVTTIPPERWDARAYWSSDAQLPGTMYDIHGGFLSDIDAFDADFFGIHSREAASMDPQQRMLLELTWEALERAMIDPRSLMNTQTGIYLGLSNSDYARLLDRTPGRNRRLHRRGSSDQHRSRAHCLFPRDSRPCDGRRHGLLLLVGGCASGCSKSSERRNGPCDCGGGESDSVSGYEYLFFPDWDVVFAGALQDVRCVCGRLRTRRGLLRHRYETSGRCTSRWRSVMASVRGTAVNQDGRSAGITAPNGPAQEAVMRAALRDAELEPDAVDYIEAHGTGTPLGDPMEVQAIGTVYGSGRSSDSPLRIGSVKTNLGHTEAAAGLTGLIKVVLMMQPSRRNCAASSLQATEPTDRLATLEDRGASAADSMERNGAIRYAGVSSFGFSGTNAHLILSSVEDPAEADETRPEVAPCPSEESLLCLSADNEESLGVLAERYVGFLRQSKNRFADICHAATTGRAKLSHRLALTTNNSENAADMLEQWLAGHPVAGLMTGAPDRPGQMAPSMEKDGLLEQIQKEFVEGGPLRHIGRASSDAVRRIDLPIYPFQRKRFWFGAPPRLKRQRQCEAAWQTLRMEAERQSQQGPLGWSPADYSERWRALDQPDASLCAKRPGRCGRFRQRNVVDC